MGERANKRPPFDLFGTIARNIRKTLKTDPDVISMMSRAPVKPKRLRGMDNLDLLRFCYHQLPNSSILQHLIVTEAGWNECGRHVLFPGTADFFGRLLDSRFSLSEDGGAGLVLPHKTFILAVPKGMTYKGLHVPSPLVTYSDNFEDRQASFERVRRLLNIPASDRIDEPEHERDAPKVTLFYHNPYDREETTSVCTLMTTEINRTLTMDIADHEDFASLVGGFKDNHILDMDLDETDGLLQMLLMRLVAGLSVYLSATDTNVLSEGLPDFRKFGIQGLDSHSRPTLSEIPTPASTNHAGTSGIMTTRRWHFRRLQAERFYRGKYSNLPRGSRWSIVREAVVGRYKATTVEHPS